MGATTRMFTAVIKPEKHVIHIYRLGTRTMGAGSEHAMHGRDTAISEPRMPYKCVETLNLFLHKFDSDKDARLVMLLFFRWKTYLVTKDCSFIESHLFSSVTSVMSLQTMRTEA